MLWVLIKITLHEAFHPVYQEKQKKNITKLSSVELAQGLVNIKGENKIGKESTEMKNLGKPCILMVR